DVVNIAIVLLVIAIPASAASWHFAAVWDGEKLWRDACVTTDGNRINAVGPCSGPSTDLSRYTAIPGLIDVHTHLTYALNNPVSRSARGAATVYLARENAIKTLRTGVTTVRDLGASNYADIAMRDLIEKSLMPGPRMFVAGFGIHIRTVKGVDA